MGFISKYFPVPKFLNPPHIGISFSDSNIKAIEFDTTLAKPHLKSFIVQSGNNSIVAGSIVNMDEVVKNLSIIKKNFNSPFVFFSIPDELTYVFPVSIPVVSGINVAESVAFTIEENVPLSLGDTVFDFIPTKISSTESKPAISIVVTACAKKEVEKFVEAIHKSGLEPVGCIHESQAITNALVLKGFSETLGIIHARENRVGIYLIKNGVVHFSTLRSILGGDYKQQFLDEYEKFSEYRSKYDVSQKEPIETILACGEFNYAQKVVEAVLDSKNHASNVKLSNVWANVLKIEEDTPSISYENSLNLAGPVGAVLSAVI